MGNRSLLLVSITGFIIGLVLTLQTRPTLTEFGAVSWMPSMVGISIVREIGPIITALVCAGKIGSGIGAELGSMMRRSLLSQRPPRIPKSLRSHLKDEWLWRGSSDSWRPATLAHPVTRQQATAREKHYEDDAGNVPVLVTPTACRQTVSVQPSHCWIELYPSRA